MKNIYLIAVAALVIGFSSCTVEKRHYMSGYHVEWHGKNKNADAPQQAEVTTPAQEEMAMTEETAPVEEAVVAPAPVEVVAPVSVKEEATASVNEKPVFQKKSFTEKYTAEATSTQELSSDKQAAGSAYEAASEQEEDSSMVSDVLLAILCIFIPFLAVYLYEDDITINFWIDLLLCFLFWLPGMIFAFLVCFAGVSL